MAIYAIGDLQGCYDSLQALLEKIQFDPADDQLWFTGDLINRGHQSLESLRFVYSLGKRAVTVLGNHDLHFLSVYADVKNARSSDTFDKLLAASDIDELAHWMRFQPLAYCNSSLKIMMTHAGVYPGWTKKALMSYAQEVEAQLQSKKHAKFLKYMYGNTPDVWNDQLKGKARLKFIVNALTRMRFCNRRGKLNFDLKGSPDKQLGKWMPWFRHPSLKCKKWRVVFGHWSVLGYLQEDNIISLDSGCVWGGQLTAVRLDDNYLGPVWQQDCSGS